MTTGMLRNKMLATVFSWVLPTFSLVTPALAAHASPQHGKQLTDGKNTGLTAVASSYENSILKHINEHRKKKGLAPLALDPYIQRLANRHSRGMALSDSLSHGGFQRRASLIQNKLGAFVVAENIACKQNSAKEVAKAWINSPPHRQNLEGKYQLTGISAVQDRKGEWFYTQIFAAKKPPVQHRR